MLNKDLQRIGQEINVKPELLGTAELTESLLKHETTVSFKSTTSFW